MNPIDNPKTEFGGTDATGTVTIAAPGQGKYNYLVDLTVKSDANYTLTVQSPSGTDIFKADCLALEGFEKVWARGLKGAENSAMIITLSAGGTMSINYQGVVA